MKPEDENIPTIWLEKFDYEQETQVDSALLTPRDKPLTSNNKFMRSSSMTRTNFKEIDHNFLSPKTIKHERTANLSKKIIILIY